MLWALLFSLIFAGPESGMINAKFKKHVKKYVVDNERKKQIVVLIKNFEKEAKALRKKEKKAYKRLAELNSNRETTPAQFNQFFNEIILDKQKLNSTKLNTRLRVQGLIEQPEWDQIVVASKTYWDKKEKKRNKEIHKLEKSFLKVEKKIKNNVSDPLKQKNALQIIGGFKEEAIRIEKAINEVNINQKAAMGKLNASETEINDLINQVFELQKLFFEKFEINHHELVAITTAEEWNKIAKSLNKIF